MGGRQPLNYPPKPITNTGKPLTRSRKWRSVGAIRKRWKRPARTYTSMVAIWSVYRWRASDMGWSITLKSGITCEHPHHRVSPAQKQQVYEGNARRVFGRLDAQLKAQGR